MSTPCTMLLFLIGPHWRRCNPHFPGCNNSEVTGILEKITFKPKWEIWVLFSFLFFFNFSLYTCDPCMLYFTYSLFNLSLCICICIYKSSHTHSERLDMCVYLHTNTGIYTYVCIYTQNICMTYTYVHMCIYTAYINTWRI